MEQYQVRTDLALEQRERFVKDEVEVSGVVVEESYDPDTEVLVTTVRIETENGASVMGKPVGNYITLEAPKMAEADEGYHSEVSEQLRRVLEACLPEEYEERNLLIVGLGNRKVTPDALGPLVVEHLHITRHLIREYGRYAFEENEGNRSISAISPGVMGQTGMETVEIIRGVVEETSPDCVIVVDALAARSIKRLNRTIQVTDTGISPGSGVGNHRNAITRKTVGVPVIAIGVPTVVDAATIVNDSIGEYVNARKDKRDKEETEHLISPHLYGMFVTPKDIDETIERTSYTISEALNALTRGHAHI